MLGQVSVSETRATFGGGKRVPMLAVLLGLGSVIALIGVAALYLWYERGAAIMEELTTFFCG